MNRAPNILLVVSDQQRPDCIGALGEVGVQTPALDRLCSEGTAFTRAYTPCPLCTPARASLLSGQYPSRHGAWSIGVDTPDSVLSLPQLLGENGYRTAIFGKSHFKSCARAGSFEAPPHSQDWEFFQNWSGPWFGFETAKINVGHVHEPHSYSMHYGLWLRERGVALEAPYFYPRPAGHPNDFVGRWELPEEFHPTRWAADETIAYLRNHVAENGEQPFMVSLNFAEPHQPWLVPAPWDTLHDETALPTPRRRDGEWEGKSSLYRATALSHANTLGWNGEFGVPDQYSQLHAAPDWTEREKEIWRVYLGMTSLLDHHLGRVLDALEELDLTRDTIVVFTSDHGDNMGDHWLWSKGGSHYDASARVPFVVRWPARVPDGEKSAALQSLVDLAPTFLQAAQLEVPAAMQGTSQLQTWADPSHATREGVLIDHRVAEGLHVNSWITDRYRLSVHSILAEDRDEVELFDFENDPHEFENVADEAATTSQLLQQLVRYRMKIEAPWEPRLAYA